MSWEVITTIGIFVLTVFGALVGLGVRGIWKAAASLTALQGEVVGLREDLTKMEQSQNTVHTALWQENRETRKRLDRHYGQIVDHAARIKGLEELDPSRKSWRFRGLGPEPEASGA